jgi:hypothetical protein
MSTTVELRGHHALPSPADWEDFERRILEGEDPQQAANARRLSLSNYRRADHQRQRELLAMSREARADEADRRLEDWVTRAEASDALKVYFHRYHANMAGRGAERVELEVRTDVSDDLNRLTEMVTAAAARGLAGRGAGDDPRDPVERGEGGAGLALAGVGGTAEPGRA